MLRDFHIYFVRSPCRVQTPLHRFHANSVDRFPMSPCAKGPELETGTSQILRLPGAPAGFRLYDHRVTPKHHDSKRKGTWGQEPMQFTCSSFGQQRGGDEGAIKILQINYTKKKANYLYTKSVQGLHFAVIICTNSS